MSPATPCLLFLLLAASGTLPAADLIPSPPAAATDGAIAVEADARQRLAFEPAPITGGACYRLVFEARAAGSPLLENNPRIHVARFENPRLFWRWEIAQADATNIVVGRSAASHQTIFSGDWRTYQDVFRAHPQAIRAKVVILPPTAPVGLEIRRARLEPFDPGETVNLNGDFSLGDNCLAGWGSPFAGAGLRTIKGRRVYDTAYGSESAAFPLDARPYRVTVKRTTYGRYQAANLYLRNGERTIKMVTVPADGMLEFVPPAGTTSGFFKIYNSYLEAVRIVPLDE